MFACLFLQAGEAQSIEAVAREFSPRVEVHRPGLVTLDIRGLGRLLGGPADIGQELRRAAADRGAHPHVAIAATRTAALVMALARAGLTVVAAGRERDSLAPLPLGVLRQLPLPDNPGLQAPGVVELLRRWGLKALGDLAALPTRPLSERLGQDGVFWQAVARGEDRQPLVASVLEDPIEERLDLEWPVEGLEPLSFVLARIFEPLCERLASLDLAATVLHAAFRLASRETATRDLQLPAPMRDPKVLRTLILLHLETHPLDGGVDRVAIRVETAPARITQFSLLSRALPVPEQMATLLARLSALLGERRVGAPALVDSHRPGAFAMAPFSAGTSPNREIAKSPNRQILKSPSRQIPVAKSSDRQIEQSSNRQIVKSNDEFPLVSFRRFRFPVPARVIEKQGRPVRVTTERRGLEGGVVEALAGPWRTSGDWWHVGHGATPAREDAGTADGARTVEQPVSLAGAHHGVPSGRVEGRSPERAQRVEGRSPERAQRVEGWNRDEWDVALADGGIYRIFRDRSRDRWFIDGIVD